MIGSLRGTLLDRGADEVTVEVGGVGYRVTVSPTTAVSLGDVGAEVFCWVHHHQREDAVTLYGFATKDERACFEALLGAHGVGPALALAILSIHTPVALARILAEDDLGALCLVPGRRQEDGGAAAHRAQVAPLGARPRRSRVGARRVRGAAGAPAARADVREALAELGYSEPEIREVMADLPPDGDAAGAAARRPAAAGRRQAVGTHRARGAAAARGAGRRGRDLRRGQPPAPHARRVRRPARAQGPPRDHPRGGPPPEPGRRPRAARRPARARQDEPGRDHRRRDGRGDPRHLGPGHRAGRRPRRHAQPARRGRRPLHRRDPPAARASSRRSSTRPWRTSRSTSCSARARPPARSGSTCPASPWSAPPPAPGSITGPLRDRFGLVARLDYYEPEDLVDIVTRAAGILGVQVDADGAWEIARRARGTPRIANRLLRRVRDFAEVQGDGAVDLPTAVRRPRHLRRRRARPRQGRPRHPLGDLRALRRRPGRPVHAGHQRGRADRDRRGRLRAVPHPGGPAHAHAPRPGGHRGRLRPPRAAPRPAPRARARTSAARACSAVAAVQRRAHWRRHGHGRARLRPAGERHRPDAGRAARRGPAARRRAARVARPSTGTCATCRRSSGPATWSWSTRPGCCRPGSGSPKPTGGAVEVLLLEPSATSDRRGRRWCGRAARCRRASTLALGDDAHGRASATTSARAAAASSSRSPDGRRRCSTCSSATARCRSRRTSPPRWPIPSATRPPTPSGPGRSPRPPPGLHLTPALLERGRGRPARRGAGRAGRRARHVPARSRSTRWRSTRCTPSATACPPPTMAGVRAGRAGRGHRHHERAGPRVGRRHRRARGAAPTCSSTATGPFARRRRAADQLPPAALVAARAGRRVRRAAVARALRRGAARRATASSASATPCSSPGSADDPVDGGHRHGRAGARRHDPHRPRRDHHAVLHAGGHQGRGAAPVVAGPRRPRRADRARQHLPPDAQARAPR